VLTQGLLESIASGFCGYFSALKCRALHIRQCSDDSLDIMSLSAYVHARLLLLVIKQLTGTMPGIVFSPCSLKSSGYNLRTLGDGLCVNFIKSQLHEKTLVNRAIFSDLLIPYVLFLLCCVFSVPILT